MKTTLIPLTEKELSEIKAGDFWTGVGFGVVALGIAIISIPAAPVALVVAGAAIGLGGDAMIGYGFSGMLNS